MQYNSKVLVNNWYEDVKLQEDVMKEFLERRQRGELLIQKMGNLLGAASQKSLLVPTGGVLLIGSMVQLYNPAPKTDLQRPATVLSLNPSESLVNSAASLSDSTGATASPHSEPSPRNLFIVKSTNGSPEGTPVTYGMNFQLVTLDKLGSQLYLFSDNVGFNNAAKKSRHQAVSFTSKEDFRTYWRAEYFNPQERFDRLGEPVKTNEKLILIHQKTGHALAVEEKFPMKNLFGREFEVSTRTFLNDHRAEMDVNHWVFRDGAE